jgi:hypothetical protein
MPMSHDDNRDERYDIPNADILDVDVWAEEDPPTAPQCAECGAPLKGRPYCRACGAPAPVCSGVCGACFSKKCVGGKRKG